MLRHLFSLGTTEDLQDDTDENKAEYNVTRAESPLLVMRGTAVLLQGGLPREQRDFSLPNLLIGKETLVPTF